MHVGLCPVAVHVGVIHVRQVLFALRRTGVIGHADGGDGGHELGRQRGLEGGGGDGGVVQRGQVLHVERVGAVVQLREVHGAETETHRPGQELLGVHHVDCGGER